MKRLRKTAEVDLDDVKKLLARVDKASDDLRDVYYILFENLKELYVNYPDLYKQIDMTVKLPTNDDAKNNVDFNNNLHEILEHFKDDVYLNGYINPQLNNNPNLNSDDEQPPQI